MSQAKVDRYKKEKENRKKLMRKQKMMGIVRKGVVAVIAVALIGWLGYSAYDMHESNKERAVTEVNYDSITDYLNGLSSAELSGGKWETSRIPDQKVGAGGRKPSRDAE